MKLQLFFYLVVFINVLPCLWCIEGQFLTTLVVLISMFRPLIHLLPLHWPLHLNISYLLEGTISKQNNLQTTSARRCRDLFLEKESSLLPLSLSYSSSQYLVEKYLLGHFADQYKTSNSLTCTCIAKDYL